MVLTVHENNIIIINIYQKVKYICYSFWGGDVEILHFKIILCENYYEINFLSIWSYTIHFSLSEDPSYFFSNFKEK